MSLTRSACTFLGVALATGAFAVPAQAAETPPPGAGPMIIGGKEARDTEGAVRLSVEGKELCSASIIAPEWVLTAKHCVEDVDEDDAEDVSFNIGSLDSKRGEEVHAKEGGIHRHDDADLALVNLDHSVETDFARVGKKSVVGGLTLRTAHVYGWGATCGWPIPESLCQSKRLKTASVVIQDATTCKDTYGGRAVCAAWRDGVSAGGDSGGPMFVIGMNGAFYQVGVLSDSDRKQSMAYTNVMEYEDWIEDVTDD